MRPRLWAVLLAAAVVLQAGAYAGEAAQRALHAAARPPGGGPTCGTLHGGAGLCGGLPCAMPARIILPAAQATERRGRQEVISEPVEGHMPRETPPSMGSFQKGGCFGGGGEEVGGGGRGGFPGRLDTGRCLVETGTRRSGAELQTMGLV